ncbi:saccharopine dehydrogenase NADP-binding domain-containing protein [Actinomadura scrupuli]|uniref:saccharopine dehydrogenase NADP-binding domain-containing protein n=1 Tax=Actinomadura scrupuli TaxID=559629 RepID=UPI003D97D40E
MTEPSGRIVLLGATGSLGRLAAGALTESGARPVLVGRDRSALRRLSAELGGDVPIAVADATDPAAMRALVQPGDVLATTAGPFMRNGAFPLKAAIEAGAIYLDTAGEAPFVQDVFEVYGPRAERRGATLIPAMAYCYVAGTLAAAIGLDEIGDAASRVDVAYFVGGGSLWPRASAGTLESIAPIFGLPGYTYRKGIVPQGRPQVRDFVVGDRTRPAATVAAGEHFTLPRLNPELQAIDVYTGMLGAATRLAARIPSPLITAVSRPSLRLMARFARRRPHRATLTARVVAIVYDATGLPLAEVHLSGTDPYEFSARLLAWGARQSLDGGTSGTGAVGPVEAFGLGALMAGCAEAGIARVSG